MLISAVFVYFFLVIVLFALDVKIFSAERACDATAPVSGVVAAIAFELIFGLQRGHKDQDRKGCPLPNHHHDDGIG